MPDDKTFKFTPELRDTLFDLRDEHVVVVDQEARPPIRILRLRHEAEHVAQYEHLPAISEVGVPLPGIVGDQFYAALPHERDADAAATALRRRLGVHVSDDDSQGTDRMVYIAPWDAPDHESLPLRLLAFSLTDSDAFDVVCQGNQALPTVDPDELLEQLVPGAAEVRGALRGRFAGVMVRVVGPPPDNWEEMTRGQHNVVIDELRAKVVAQEAEIVEAVRAQIQGD